MRRKLGTCQGRVHLHPQHFSPHRCVHTGSHATCLRQWVMAWSKPKDPLLTTPLYRRNRAILKRLRLPCAVCGRTINYSQPGAFVAGHIVSRHKAKLYGWTEAMINSLSNLQPECKQCSYRTGAREGQQAMRAKRRLTRRTVAVSDAHRW